RLRGIGRRRRWRRLGGCGSVGLGRGLRLRRLLRGGAHRNQQCGCEHPFPSTHDSSLHKTVVSCRLPVSSFHLPALGRFDWPLAAGTWQLFFTTPSETSRARSPSNPPAAPYEKPA